MTMWAEVFLLHVTDDENALTPTHQDIKCQHGACQRLCKHFEAPKLKTKAEDTMRPMLCPTESDLKYKMTRFSMESVNLFIVEMECACNIKVSLIPLHPFLIISLCKNASICVITIRYIAATRLGDCNVNVL